MGYFQKGVLIVLPSAILLSLVFYVVLNFVNLAKSEPKVAENTKQNTVVEVTKESEIDDIEEDRSENVSQSTSSNTNTVSQDQNSAVVPATKVLAVSPYRCIGCGRCARTDSEHFRMGSDGVAAVTSQQNLDSALLQSAIERCPGSAITLS